jgi:hypothetical protein
MGNMEATDAPYGRPEHPLGGRADIGHDTEGWRAMRLGSKAGLAVAVVAVTSLGVPTVAQAVARHHHRPAHHVVHHPGPVVPTTPPTPPAAAVPACVAVPNPTQLAMTSALGGAFGAAIQCTGFAASDVVVISSTRLAFNCATVSFNGKGPTATTMVDLFGRLSVSVSGNGCGPGDFSIQVMGPNESVDALLTLHLF